jgi:hypothetical protein
LLFSAGGQVRGFHASRSPTKPWRRSEANIARCCSGWRLSYMHTMASSQRMSGFSAREGLWLQPLHALTGRTGFASRWTGRQGMRASSLPSDVLLLPEANKLIDQTQRWSLAAGFETQRRISRMCNHSRHTDRRCSSHMMSCTMIPALPSRSVLLHLRSHQSCLPPR